MTYIGYTRKGQNIGLVVLGSGMGEKFWGKGATNLRIGGSELLGTGRGLVPPCLIPG